MNLQVNLLEAPTATQYILETRVIRIPGTLRSHSEVI